MSIRNTLKRGVATAFKAVQDLTVPMVLVRKTGTAFDFASGQASETVQNLAVKGIVIDGKKKSGEKNSKEDTVMFQTETAIDLSAFDKIQRGTETWTVGPLIARSDFIIIATCYKELS